MKYLLEKYFGISVLIIVGFLITLHFSTNVFKKTSTKGKNSDKVRNGFGYKFEPINTFEYEENILEQDGVKIEVCNKSLLYILGTRIDWKEDIMGRGFEFENPLAQASCGCGVSFSPKLE